VLFHIAGAVDFRNDWEKLQRVNVDGTKNILTAARSVGLRRVVYTSSIVAVGGSRNPDVRDETATWNLGPYRVAYVATKREAEEAALGANGAGLEIVAVNPA